MDARGIVFAVLALGGMPTSGNPSVNNYDELRSAAVRKCQAVDAGEYQTGLFFNPEGYRSYYARSLCYLQAAIAFRDIELCALVKRRRALFSSSWGYSESNCRKLVSEGIAKDREVIDRLMKDYQQGHVQLASSVSSVTATAATSISFRSSRGRTRTPTSCGLNSFGRTPLHPPCCSMSPGSTSRGPPTKSASMYGRPISSVGSRGLP